MLRGWPGWTAWSLGYLLAALATLTKGTQAPVAFIGATVAFLALERRWRTLLSPGHALGLVVYSVAVGAWLIPLTQRLGWEGLRVAFVEPGRERFDAPWWQFLKHWALFPLEALVIMLPWSLLLPGCRSLLGRTHPWRSTVLFLFIAMAALFVPLWVAPWARGRYFLPAFPLAAALIGLVVANAASNAAPRQLVARFTRTAGWVLLLGAAALLPSPWTRDYVGRTLGALVADPWGPVGLAALAAAAAAFLLLRAARGSVRPAYALTAMAACIVVVYHALMIRALAAPALDTPGAVRAARAAIPAGPPTPRRRSRRVHTSAPTPTPTRRSNCRSPGSPWPPWGCRSTGATTSAR
jgi:4-amino-4-deoxy-L-arabinose transferase-like glycosyltransferase